MFKKLAALMLALFTFAAFAAVDVNKATQAELDGIKGIGPGIAGKILDERKKGNFKDWNDFVERVKGVGEGNAAKFSAEGLTVNGATFKGAAAAPAKAAPAKAEAAAKPAAKEEKAAAPAKDAKPAKDEKAAKPAKEDKPAAKAGDKAEKVKGAATEAANDPKAKPLEAVGAKK
jgi:competence protein ComEA